MLHTENLLTLKIKLTLLLLLFYSSLFSVTYVCTYESRTDGEEETFYLVEYGDGMTYLRTEQLNDEYVFDPEDEGSFINEDFSPMFIIHETEVSLLLGYPGFTSMYKFTLLDKIDNIWITDSMSPHFEFNEVIKEYLKENTFSTRGTFTILNENNED